MSTLEQIIYPAVDEINSTLDETKHLAKSSETVVFGDGSSLDSISLVTLIVTIERITLEETGKAITLASEKAFSRKQSPFKSISTLAEFVDELLAEEA